MTSKVVGGGCEDSINIVNSTGSIKQIIVEDSYADAIDIDFSPSENDSYSIQKSNSVFRKNGNGISSFFHHFNLISDTAAPVGIIGNTLFSLPTITSSK